MKKILFSIFLAGFSFVFAGNELLHQWRFTEPKVPGMQYPSGNLTYRIADLKTPEGDPCGEFTIRKAAQKSVSWSIQINFFSNQKIIPGTRYRYSFFICGTPGGKMSANCTQNQKPWKTIGNSGSAFTLGSEWRKIEKEFTADMEYDGSVRSPMLMAGALPQGSVFRIGGVKLEKVFPHNLRHLFVRVLQKLKLPVDIFLKVCKYSCITTIQYSMLYRNTRVLQR